MTCIIVVCKYEIKSRCNTGTTLYQKGLTDLLTKICIFDIFNLMQEGSADVKLKINRMLRHMWSPLMTLQLTWISVRRLVEWLRAASQSIWTQQRVLENSDHTSCIHHRFSPANSSETIWNIRPYLNSAPPSWHILPFFLFPHSERTGGASHRCYRTGRPERNTSCWSGVTGRSRGWAGTAKGHIINIYIYYILDLNVSAPIPSTVAASPPGWAKRRHMFRPFWVGFPLLNIPKLPFGVTNRREKVAISCRKTHWKISGTDDACNRIPMVNFDRICLISLKNSLNMLSVSGTWYPKPQTHSIWQSTNARHWGAKFMK